MKMGTSFLLILFFSLELLDACSGSLDEEKKFVSDEKSSAVIYGSDSREEASDLRGHAFRNSRAIAALMSPAVLRKSNDEGFYQVSGISLTKAKAVCDDERFAEQMVAARCTAVLVSSNRMITAGHCIKNAEQCANTYVVFNYVHNNQNGSDTRIDSQNVFRCVRRVSGKLDSNRESDESPDYSLFEIDRDVKFATPVNLQFTNDLPVGFEIYTIGHSMGLPMKYADGKILSNQASDNIFRADLDAFPGNSGSPVFSNSSHAMIGIFVGGADDFIVDKERKCRVTKKCDVNECKGEVVFKLSRIKKVFSNEIQMQPGQVIE